MRKKEMKLVITFHTTADAMALEKYCRDNGLPGRLIPVPRTISAGCGMAWCTDEEMEDVFSRLLNEHTISSDGIYHCLI